MTQSELLARQIRDTRDWTMGIIADFSGDDWTFQPAKGMGHAIWLCGHLAFAQDLLVHVRCLGKDSLLDASFGPHFPIGKDVASAADHDYPPIESVFTAMADVHKQTMEAVTAMSDNQLAEAAYGKDGSTHPHYSDKAGAICHCNRHEAFHTGQLASIRRLLGKGFLR